MPLSFAMRNNADGSLSYVLALRGELDIAMAEEIRRYVKELAGVSKHVRLIVDARALTFIDSSGIGVLVHARKTLRTRFLLVGVQPPVQHVFDTAGLAGYWNRFGAGGPDRGRSLPAPERSET